jgi:hypothetical protein
MSYRHQAELGDNDHLRRAKGAARPARPDDRGRLGGEANRGIGRATLWARSCGGVPRAQRNPGHH